MRSLIVKMLLFTLLASVSSGAEVTPTFTHNQERSIEGSPHLTVTFPDGYTDNLILSKHSEDDNDLCHYLGHLEKEREACVAMTGCLGQEDVEFTILSKHATKSVSIRWTQTGLVEHLEPPALPTTGKTLDTKDDMVAVAEESGAVTRKDDKMQRTHVLEYRVMYSIFFQFILVCEMLSFVLDFLQ